MENPFKPFQPLTEPDLPWYRGRDAEVDQLYELVTGTNVTLVFGEPGVGKTSLVHCGLARKFDASDWLGIWVRRGGHLVRSLKAELVNKLCDSTRKELEKTDGTLPVTDLLKKVYLDHFKTLYLIFDAFEELYASGSPEERAEFYGTLACLIEQKSNCRIIFIIREDYHGKLEELVKTLPQLFSKGLKVDPMPAADAEAEVIRSYLGHPAVVVHPSVEAVSGKIRAACTGEDGQTVSLAYLQVFLHTLWEKAEQQDGRALIHPAAVDNVAEYGNIIGYYLAEAVRSIDTEDRKDEIAIWAFLQDLVDQDGERKIMPLAHYTAAGFQRAPEWAEELVRQKILKYTGPGEVELTHDCLVPVIRARRTNTARPRLATP
ncbi:MAG TPA: ATP-binding protein, partial [Chitinophagaceae bacterium]|nr:ATP-binding protein [Chitinophagaceae bacterium]